MLEQRLALVSQLQFRVMELRCSLILLSLFPHLRYHPSQRSQIRQRKETHQQIDVDETKALFIQQRRTFKLCKHYQRIWLFVKNKSYCILFISGSTLWRVGKAEKNLTKMTTQQKILWNRKSFLNCCEFSVKSPWGFVVGYHCVCTNSFLSFCPSLPGGLCPFSPLW